jgi:NAD(P)-dependent dehydrogenase (short-subunit alcohol dehydrogenase family)
MMARVARGLAARHAHVVLAVHSRERGQAAAIAIQAENPDASLEVVELDLAHLASVQRFAETVRSSLERLDLLINNDGIGSPSLRHTPVCTRRWSARSPASRWR